MAKVVTMGFSLLELILVLGLFAVFVLVAIPSFRSLIMNHQVDDTAHHLRVMIRYTRHLAVQQQRIIELCGSAKGENCDGHWSLGMLVRQVSDGKKWRFYPFHFKALRLLWRSSFGKNTKLAFLPTGFTQGQQGTFYVCSRQTPGKGRALIVTLSGRVRISHDQHKILKVC